MLLIAWEGPSAWPRGRRHGPAGGVSNGRGPSGVGSAGGLFSDVLIHLKAVFKDALISKVIRCLLLFQEKQKFIPIFKVGVFVQ